MSNTLKIRHGFANIANVVIAYEDFGDVNGDPTVLIMGLGSQLVMCPLDFVKNLLREVIRVIRFNNRDIASHPG